MRTASRLWNSHTMSRKVLGVVARYDGNSVLRGLDDVVSAARDQASAYEGDIGQAIERGQFSDRVNEKD